MPKYKRLWDLYRFPGFRPEQRIIGLFGDPRARVISLIRRGKKLYVAVAAPSTFRITTERFGECGIFLAETLGSIWKWRFGVWPVGSAAK